MRRAAAAALAALLALAAPPSGAESGGRGVRSDDPGSDVSFGAVRVRPLSTTSRSGGTAATPARLLVFTKTAGFRHDSIPAAVAAVRGLGARNGFAVDVTEDSGTFSDTGLRRYRAVAFLLTTGDVLSDSEQAAFQRFVRASGGYVGVHSAADTEHEWPWYVGLVGASFRNHPAVQRAAIDVAVPRQGSTARLPKRWVRTDEWYNFDRNPRRSVRVLATLDETTYSAGDGAMGRDHPIAWLHEYDGGRAWYTAGGHTAESYAEPLFLGHLLGGIRYAADIEPPRFESIATSLDDRRLAVTARYADCPRCRAELRVRLPARWTSVPMQSRGGVASATTVPLPPGRRQISVVLVNPRNGLRAVAGRTISVP